MLLKRFVFYFFMTIPFDLNYFRQKLRFCRDAEINDMRDYLVETSIVAGTHERIS